MDDLDRKFAKAIVDKLSERIGRDLTKGEIEAFFMTRSGIAYEMIFDFISDNKKTRNELESYVEEVTTEKIKNVHKNS